MWNGFAKTVHAENAHWWIDPVTGEKLEGDRGEKLMLMVSEIAEAMEGERKDLMDDHLQHRKAAEVELADFVIRALDYAGRWNINLENRDGQSFLPPFPENRAAALMQIVRQLALADNGTRSNEDFRLSRAVALAVRYCEKHGYDLLTAVAEKRAYNQTRADHKPEARLAAGGKKW